MVTKYRSQQGCRAWRPSKRIISAAASSQASSEDSSASRSSSSINPYALLAACFGVSAAAKLAAPAQYVNLAHSACPNALAHMLVRPQRRDPAPRHCSALVPEGMA